MIEKEIFTLTEGSIDGDLTYRLAGSILYPDNLKEIIPSYGQFSRIATFGEGLLWAKNPEIIKPAGKTVVGLLGPSAGGKDSIMDLLEESSIRSQIKVPWTTTTRNRRSSNDRQYFLTSAEFAKAEEDGGFFIETIQQGQNHYGTSVAGMNEALTSDESIVLWRGELEGSQRIKTWLAQTHPEVPMVNIFILPQMHGIDLAWRIKKQRGLEQAMNWRIAKAIREVIYAPQLADVLLINPPEIDQKPHRAAAAVVILFNNLIAHH